MIVDCLKQIIKAALIAILFIISGYIITLLLYDRSLSLEFLYYAIFKFNGILVFGVGFGLMFFIHDKSSLIVLLSKNIFEGDVSAFSPFIRYLYKASSYKDGLIISIPIYIAGSISLYNAGYPLYGFPKYYLLFFSTLIYFVASQILHMMIMIILAFKSIDDNLESFTYNSNNSHIYYDSLNMFLVVSSTVGLLAVYLGFRGTVTAGFSNLASNEFIEKLLLLPLLLFLPAPLALSFYPRYTLRRVYEKSIISIVNDIESKIDTSNYLELLNVKKLVLDIKERMMKDGNRPPILSLKDSGSAFFVLLIIMQIIANHDVILRGFFQGLWK